MHSLQGVSVLVLGLGASGLALARWCVRSGAQVTVADTRAQPPQWPALQAECPQVRLVSGPLTAQLLQGGAVRAVFRSPGLAPHETAPVLDAARAAGLWVGSELDVFAAVLAQWRDTIGYTPAVLAITGTNGKTTVTSLTAQLVARAGKTVQVAGNIGPTLLDTLGAAWLAAQAAVPAQQATAGEAGQADDADDADQANGAAPAQPLTLAQALPQVWVLELSSFQLDGCEGFEPTAATVLNLSQDHLDWHGSMAHYGAAKARIFGNSALMVLPQEDEAVQAMWQQAQARMPAPTTKDKRAHAPERARTCFGGGLPQRPLDWGIQVVNGMAWLVRAEAPQVHSRRERAGAPELTLQRLMPADALRIRGRHNATNALAALALASAAGCALAPMLYGLREYRGEPHRVQTVAQIHGVLYIDDSKGTNVGATVAAVQGIGADRRVVLILGGDGKGQDFAPLREPVAQYARAVVLLGRDGPRMGQALQGLNVPQHSARDMAHAVQLCTALAQPGDAVLLSPACASLDMFRDYAHRAEAFGAAVGEWAQAQGAELGGEL